MRHVFWSWIILPLYSSLQCLSYPFLKFHFLRFRCPTFLFPVHTRYIYILFSSFSSFPYFQPLCSFSLIIIFVHSVSIPLSLHIYYFHEGGMEWRRLFIIWLFCQYSQLNMKGCTENRNVTSLIFIRRRERNMREGAGDTRGFSEIGWEG